MRLKRFGAAYATIVVCALVAMAVGAVTATAGNSLNAKFCQTSWQTLLDGTGASFTNQGVCIAWGAQGNTYVSLVVSTSTNPDGLFSRPRSPGTGCCQARPLPWSERSPVILISWNCSPSWTPTATAQSRLTRFRAATPQRLAVTRRHTWERP